MIQTIPNWLQEAITWINQKYPEEENVNLTILYGYDSVICDEKGEQGGFAAYNTEAKSIYLADPKVMQESYNLSEEDERTATIGDLFHEYRHHQQNIQGLPFDEEDAEAFAEAMYRQYKEDMKL